MKKFQDVVLPTHDADMLKWKEEHKISPEKKVFCVTGGYPDMKAALEHRGWVENPDQDSDFFDFKWTLRQREVKYDRLQEHQRVNHFRKNGELSTKVGLLHNVKNLVWYRGVDVDTFQPNSYDLADVEVPDFVEEFKVTKVSITHT
ncbi:MAG: hypothetical protein P4M11_15710 [Candidatus Pacebacteria bacterium]|nr:hypothetical protein [Candidatus Paceibacterota bacterium]